MKTCWNEDYKCKDYNNGEGSTACAYCNLIKGALDSDVPLKEKLLDTIDAAEIADSCRNYNDVLHEYMRACDKLDRKEKAVFALKLADFSIRDTAFILNISFRQVRKILINLSSHTTLV